MKSILDKSFRYTSSLDTDLHKTFARIRREQQREASKLNQQGTKSGRVTSSKPNLSTVPKSR